MKKENFIIILLLCLFTSVDTEAQKKPLGNGIYWELENNGVLTISGKGEMPDYYAINVRHDPVAPFRKMITKGKVCKIIIGEGITSIGNFSFYADSWDGSKKVKEIQLPSTLEKIGKGAFEFLGVEHIVLGNKLKIIDDSAFAFTRLTNIEFPTSLSIIGESAFYGCNIHVLNIPVNIQAIGDEAFKNNHINTLNISNKYINIGKEAFIQKNDKYQEILYNGEILSLPIKINLTNCTDYGLSEESLMRYLSIRDNEGNIIWEANKNRKINNYVDYYVVEENDKKGVIKNGKWVIPLSNTYSEIKPLAGNYNYIKVRSNGYYGVMTTDGQEIIPTNRGYTSIGDYNRSQGTFTFTKKGYTVVCNIDGKEISITRLAPTADDIKEKGNYTNVVAITNGDKKFYKVSKSGHYGLTDAEGRVVVPVEMDALEDISTGYLKFKLNGFWGVMNYAGNIIVDTSRGYTSIGNYISFTKRFPYTMTGYKGEFDLTGKEISRIKVETTNTSTASNSSSSNGKSSSSNSNNSGTQRVIIEQHGPVQVWVACGACYGGGRCSVCGGTGRGSFSNGSCLSCGYSGRCSYCAGQGGHYETQYR